MTRIQPVISSLIRGVDHRQDERRHATVKPPYSRRCAVQVSERSLKHGLECLRLALAPARLSHLLVRPFVSECMDRKSRTRPDRGYSGKLFTEDIETAVVPSRQGAAETSNARDRICWTVPSEPARPAPTMQLTTLPPALALSNSAVRQRQRFRISHTPCGTRTRAPSFGLANDRH
jgi:hypothetical protein